eukprot:1176130-Prorocentrum_minimum.AAC.1
MYPAGKSAECAKRYEAVLNSKAERFRYGVGQNNIVLDNLRDVPRKLSHAGDASASFNRSSTTSNVQQDKTWNMHMWFSGRNLRRNATAN